MKRKFLIVLSFCVLCILPLTQVGCGNALGTVDEYIEVKANPGTLTLSKSTSTTITVRIFDAGSNKGYKGELSTTDGGYFDEPEIYLFRQTSATTQFYPADLTGGQTQKIVTVRIKVNNLENFKEYTGEVRITVKQ
jgi:hypothetical protein